MNINFYRLNKTKNYLFLEISNFIEDENSFLNELASFLSDNIDILQIRNCILSTKKFIEIANKIKLICAEFNVIFLVSDRCDIALAINCDGICLGKDEISAHFARHLLGDDKIIGSNDPNDTDADFFIAAQNTQIKKEKIYYSKKETKQFQGNCLVYLNRAYP